MNASLERFDRLGESISPQNTRSTRCTSALLIWTEIQTVMTSEVLILADVVVRRCPLLHCIWRSASSALRQLSSVASVISASLPIRLS